MSTAYTTTAGGNPAMTGTAAATGQDFVLATGAARAFFTVPVLATGEALELQIKETNGGSYVTVGTLCNNGDSVGVVTSRGGGSTFRVNKSVTGGSVAVFFD
jgi:hypothetical protein